MVYKDYLKAAKRHKETCSYLLSCIEDVQNYIDVPLQDKILLNIYYLSGYVIECSLSYTVFRLLNYDPKANVYDYPNFNTYFKEHSFKYNYRKIELIAEYGGNIPSHAPIIGEKKVEDLELSMYSNWDATARYLNEYPDFDLSHRNVRSFFDLATEIHTTLRRI